MALNDQHYFLMDYFIKWWSFIQPLVQKDLKNQLQNWDKDVRYIKTDRIRPSNQ